MKADPLYMTEAQIAQRLGVTVKEWEATATVLERGGLPKPEALFGNRRYWPAVRSFLDRRYDLEPQSGQGDPALDGEERWDLADRGSARRRA